MSYFKIQRKLTQISPKGRSTIEKKYSYSKSPKRITITESKDNIIRRKATTRHTSQESNGSKDKNSEIQNLLMKEGLKAYKQKNTVRALECFKQIYKNNRKSAELAYYIGSCLLNQNKNHASIMYFNNCLIYNPLYSQYTYLYVAVNFKILDNIRQAIKILKQGLHHFPNFEEGLFYKAKLHLKVRQFEEAFLDFTKCTELNSKNGLAYVFAADCLKFQGKTHLAIERYKRIISKSRKYAQLANLRLIELLIERQSYSEALEQVQKLNSCQSSELNYYKGLVYCKLGNRREGTVYLDICLTSCKESHIAIKALKELLYISLLEKDFFGAENRISRAVKMKLPIQSFSEWKMLIEGVNDLIKRKNESGMNLIHQAIEEVHTKEKSRRISAKEVFTFKEFALTYYAYSLFVNKEIGEAINSYSMAISFKKDHQEQIYNQHLVQGIIHHIDKKYDDACQEFEKAFLVNQRIEPLFLNCINMVQQFKNNNGDKDYIFEKVLSQLTTAEVLSNKQSLIYFYHSLVALYLGKNSLTIIDQAIEVSEQPVSEYYFIRALALFGQGKLSEALKSITKAIQIDQNIEEFYKQRSKYYFIANQYDLAIQDCKRAQLLIEEEEQIDLLLTFYSYLNNDYEECFKYLKNVTIKKQEGKFKQFQQALMLRLGFYSKLGILGQLISNLWTHYQLQASIIQEIEQMVKNRKQYSEFSVYFYHLLLSVYYAKQKNYNGSLNHLFGCLEQIQLIIDQKQVLEDENSTIKEMMKEKLKEITLEETEDMLNEVKYNIVIVSLMKQSYEQAQNFIRVFINETDSLELKEVFIELLKMIKKECIDKEQVQVEIDLFAQTKKISDNFVKNEIKINGFLLTTKMVVFYPIKLKFSISPEFDPSYLFNFDIDKIQHKLLPPWLKSGHQITFTDQICDYSAIRSETERSESELRSLPTDFLKEKFKLDEKLEAKIKKMIEKE